MAGKSRIGEVYLQVAPVLDGLSDAIAEQVNQGMKDANKETASQSEELGEENGKKMAKGVATAAAAGAIATAIGAQFLKGYENAMEQISADTDVSARLNLSVEQSDEMSEAVKNLYTGAYGESYTEMAEGMESIMGTIQGAREMSAEELEVMGRDIANLSSQYDAEAGEISRAVNGMLGTGFSADTDEAFQTIHNGFQVMGEYGTEWIDTLREFTGEFQTFGLEGDAAIQLMKEGMDSGIMQTDTWADALNELNIRLGDGSADEFLNNIGLDPDQLRAQIAEGGDAAQQAFSDIMIGLQENGDMEDFAGILGSVGEDFELEINKMDFSVLQQGLGETTQSLDEFDAAVNSGIDDQFLEIQRTFEQAFTDAMIPVLEALLPIIQSIVDVLSENQWILQVLVPLLGVVMVGAILLMTAALWGMAAAGWAAIAPFLPIIAIVAAIIIGIGLLIAAVWFLITHWEEIHALMIDVAGNVIDWFVEAWDNVIAWFADVWGDIGQWFSDLWNGIADFFVGLWDGVIGWFQDVFYGVRDFFVDLWNGIIEYFVGVYNTLKSIINDIIDMIPGARFVVDVGGGIINGIRSWFGGGHSVSMMADGGTIPATPGGKLAILGEAGRDEVVMDKGKWNRLLDQLNREGTGNGGTVIDVGGVAIYQQPGESTEELMERLNEALYFNGLRG